MIVSKSVILGSHWEMIKRFIRSEGLVLDSWSSSFLSILDKDIDKYQSDRGRLIYLHGSGSFSIEREIEKSNLLNPSNILINLITNTSSIDIYLCNRLMKTEINELLPYQDESAFLESFIDDKIKLLCKIIDGHQREYKIDLILK